MGTAHEGSQQKPIQTMQLPKEVGTEGPAAKALRGLPEKAARVPLPPVCQRKGACVSLSPVCQRKGACVSLSPVCQLEAVG